mmetsp:Transcript_7066/g.15979  ORF Transcript_7066/g.15979 Transcript_7066/m.15979 type:complete len:118 (-) Transcript_7066:2101-2454(-)
MSTIRPEGLRVTSQRECKDLKQTNEIRKREGRSKETRNIQTKTYHLPKFNQKLSNYVTRIMITLPFQPLPWQASVHTLRMSLHWLAMILLRVLDPGYLIPTLASRCLAYLPTDRPVP